MLQHTSKITFCDFKKYLQIKGSQNLSLLMLTITKATIINEEGKQFNDPRGIANDVSR